MVRRLTPILLLTLLLTLLSTGNASAHAEFKSATPAPDSTLASAPDRVVIVFTEELEPDGNLIQVTDASGATVDQGDTALATSDAQRATMSVSLQSGLGDGVYTVSWKNAGADGHSEEGNFSFTVGAATATPAAALPATGAADMPLAFWLLAALLVAATGVVLRRAAGRRG